MTKINKRRVAKPKAQSPVAKSAKENVEPSPARRSLRQSVSRHRVSYRFSSTESDENDDESSEFEANSESEDEAWDDELLPLTELKVFTLQDLEKAKAKQETPTKMNRRSMNRTTPNFTPKNKGTTPKPTRKSSIKEKMRRRSLLTPQVPQRLSMPMKVATPLQDAQARLHVSAVPLSLPCREQEFAEICIFTESKIRERGSGCMYISGVPGTGKTATVKEVIRTLKEQVMEEDLDDFDFVEINGMRLTEPNQAYVQIWKQLNQGNKVTAAHAHQLLDKRFATKAKRSTVLLVDELDMLWNRKQTVLYNLFDWPTQSQARLIVLAIANTMDLPEKMMMNRISSRMGLTRLQFAPYTHLQLQEIVSCRLAGLDVFDQDALQLVSRKVASLSGDARRALDICRRATEIAERDAQNGLVVGLEHVTKAHEEMFCSPRIMAIRTCSKYEKVFLRVIVECFKRTGIEETTFDRIFTNFNDYLCALKLPRMGSEEMYELCSSLASCRLILAEPGRLGPQMKIWLNVSTDDISFALAADKL